MNTRSPWVTVPSVVHSQRPVLWLLFLAAAVFAAPAASCLALAETAAIQLAAGDDLSQVIDDAPDGSVVQLPVGECGCVIESERGRRPAR